MAMVDRLEGLADRHKVGLADRHKVDLAGLLVPVVMVLRAVDMVLQWELQWALLSRRRRSPTRA
jgi:hypothetical protein